MTSDSEGKKRKSTGNSLEMGGQWISFIRPKGPLKHDRVEN